MITQYGMSAKFGLMGLATQENQYLSGRVVLNCGDDTATEVDHEVMELLHKSYEEAKALLNDHRKALDKIAEYLIKKETITGKEFMKIFRAVEKGMEIPENLDELELPEEKKEEEPQKVKELPEKEEPSQQEKEAEKEKPSTKEEEKPDMQQE